MSIYTPFNEYWQLACHGINIFDQCFKATFHLKSGPYLTKLYVAPQTMWRVFLSIINNLFRAASERKINAYDSFNPETLLSVEPYLNPSGGLKGIIIWVTDNEPTIPGNHQESNHAAFYCHDNYRQGRGLEFSQSYVNASVYSGSLNIPDEPVYRHQ